MITKITECDLNPTKTGQLRLFQASCFSKGLVDIATGVIIVLNIVLARIGYRLNVKDKSE